MAHGDNIAPVGDGNAGSRLPMLQAMLDEMEAAPDEVRPSGYWSYLNELNLRQLEERGMEEFKRTVNGNYFQWLPTTPRDAQFRRLLRYWLRHPSPALLHARVLDAAPFLDSRVGNPLAGACGRKGYAIFVGLLWEYTRSLVPEGLLERLEEPSLGHPLWVEHRGRRITQDLCNSALEFATITDSLPARGRSDDLVVELGAGYGRLAWVFLREWPGVRYVLVDIPPALAVAQHYLASLFPGRPLFRFRRFDDFGQFRDEFERAEIAFLTPNQLDLVPDLSATLFINVSSLHEMRPEQIAHYFRAIARHCSGWFYTKQSIRSVNPYDGVVIRRDDYPVPAHWQTVFDRRHPVQTHFFEALYDLRRSKRPETSPTQLA